MKKLFVVFLILIHTVTIWAGAPKYLIVFADGTEAICYILNNDPLSKRLHLQYENDIRKWWISYYQIRTIIEAESQKDVTGEFVMILPPTNLTLQQKQPDKSQMSSGTIIIVAIAGTVMFLLLLGALASD